MVEMSDPTEKQALLDPGKVKGGGDFSIYINSKAIIRVLKPGFLKTTTLLSFLYLVSILLLTYLLTPWCRVLLEKLTGLQLIKKFPAFHGTRKFITALTSVRHQSLSWANPIQSIYPHPTSWRSILILSIHLRQGLPSGLFPSGFPTKTLYTPLPHPYAPHAQPISFFPILSPAQYWVRSTNHLASVNNKISNNNNK